MNGFKDLFTAGAFAGHGIHRIVEKFLLAFFNAGDALVKFFAGLHLAFTVYGLTVGIFAAVIADFIVGRTDIRDIRSAGYLQTVTILDAALTGNR